MRELKELKNAVETFTPNQEGSARLMSALKNFRDAYAGEFEEIRTLDREVQDFNIFGGNRDAVLSEIDNLLSQDFQEVEEQEEQISVPLPKSYPLPEFYVEAEYEKDDREPIQKLAGKLKAARGTELGSGLRYNLARGVAGAAQDLGYPVEMPNNDREAEQLLQRFKFEGE